MIVSIWTVMMNCVAMAVVGVVAWNPAPDGTPSGNQADRRLLDYRETARYLGIGERTLAKLKADGTLPFVRIAGRVLFDRVDLDSLIAARKERSSGTSPNAAGGAE